MLELNKVLLVGRLTADPELRYTQTGTAVASLRVAADHRIDKDRKETLFIGATAWGKLAEFTNEYFRKGSAIMIEGRLRLETWEDRNGGGKRERIVIVAERIQFAETKKEAEARGGSSRGEDGPQYDEPPTSSAPGNTTDDLPF
jgi:single-strand DNA-binding protein